jgi:hypothetical protein
MKLYILSFAILISTLSFSQGFKAGVFAGLVASQVDGDQSEGYHKLGFQGGAYTRYLLNDRFSFDSEIKFIQKGSSHNDEENNFFFTIRLNYIEVPLYISYQIREQLYVGAGITLAHLIKANVDDPYGAVAENYLSYKPSDMNALVSLKYLFSDHFWADTKFAYSLLYINKESPRQFNNLFSFSLGYEL